MHCLVCNRNVSGVAKGYTLIHSVQEYYLNNVSDIELMYTVEGKI